MSAYTGECYLRFFHLEVFFLLEDMSPGLIELISTFLFRCFKKLSSRDRVPKKVCSRNGTFSAQILPLGNSFSPGAQEISLYLLSPCLTLPIISFPLGSCIKFQVIASQKTQFLTLILHYVIPSDSYYNIWKVEMFNFSL